MSPQRIRLSRRKGWRKPENAIVVARPTKWGNPWRVIPVRDSHFAFSAAADVIHATSGNSIGRFAYGSFDEAAAYWATRAFNRDLSPELRAAARTELAGHDLACWCPLDRPCHADVLLELANGRQR